jgi:hypothetical protein
MAKKHENNIFRGKKNMPSKWQKMLKITYFGWATLIFGEYFTVALLNANKIFLTEISLITVGIGRRIFFLKFL